MSSVRFIQLEKSERRHYSNTAEKYIMWEDLNFAWLPNELEIIKKGWEDGTPTWGIAEKVQRDQTEVVMLIWNMLEKGKLQPREGSLVGCKTG